MAAGGQPAGSHLPRAGVYRIRCQPVQRVWLDGNNMLSVTEDNGQQLMLLGANRPYFHDRSPMRRGVYCQIGNLCAVTKARRWNRNTFDQYWYDIVRRQFGPHVFVNHNGQVKLVRLWLTIHGNHLQPIVPSPYAQLYPCVRCQLYVCAPAQLDDLVASLLDAGTGRNVEVKAQVVINTGDVVNYRATMYWLTLGMCYAQTPQRTHIARDCAHFNRDHPYDDEPYNPVNSYVLELTDDNMGRVIDAVRAGNGRRFAIYVCAGAKLSVLDDQLPTEPNALNPLRPLQPHNRSLIQQGGVVVCEGELLMTVPKYDRPTNTIQECILSGALHSVHDAVGFSQNAAHYQNPVLFLAPHDSEHGSIAWQLDVELKATDGRQYRLEMPEGGRIEAIVKWEEGIRELRARHLYERRHDSHVQMDGPQGWYVRHQFQAPQDEALMQLIVTNQMPAVAQGDEGIYRDVECDIHVNHPQFRANHIAGQQRNSSSGQDLPIAYNAHRVLNWTPPDAANTRPPMPPAWPFVQYWAGEKRHDMYVAPDGRDRHLTYAYNNDYQIEANFVYESADPTTKYTLAAVNYPNHIYKFAKQPLATEPTAKCDGVNAYLGVDGYVWAKVHAASIGEYQSRYYEPVGRGYGGYYGGGGHAGGGYWGGGYRGRGFRGRNYWGGGYRGGGYRGHYGGGRYGGRSRSNRRQNRK